MPRVRPPGPSLQAARTAAHRLAMAPFAFQAARAARRTGLLEQLHRGPVDAGALARSTGLPSTSVAVLLDALLAIELVAEHDDGTWGLTTIGTVWLLDQQVAVDAEFAHGVCWDGLADLEASLRQARPVGLARMGPWSTVYEGLAQLDPATRAAWFAYDHGHSDAAFPQAIACLRRAGVQRILDVGGNTGRFATAFLDANPHGSVTLLDLPGQAAEARTSLAGRPCTVMDLDLLDHQVPFPDDQQAVWMSQFLDCFAPTDVVALLRRAAAALSADGSVWVLEVCPDDQAEPAAAGSLRLASLYFTAIANGVSRFYRLSDLLDMAREAGLGLVERHSGLGTAHTLLRLRPSCAG